MDISVSPNMMSERIREKINIQIGVWWLWMKKHGIELLNSPKLIKWCSANRRSKPPYI